MCLRCLICSVLCSVLRYSVLYCSVLCPPPPVLHLDNNQLTQFPARTHLWTKLATLTFQDNAVRELPPEASQWKSITVSSICVLV